MLQDATEFLPLLLDQKIFICLFPLHAGQGYKIFECTCIGVVYVNTFFVAIEMVDKRGYIT